MQRGLQVELETRLHCQKWSVEGRSDGYLRGPERYWNRGVFRHPSVLLRPMNLAVWRVFQRTRGIEAFFVNWKQCCSDYGTDNVT